MLKFLTGIQANYNALTPKSNDSLYFCSDTGRIYKGEKLYTKEAIFLDEGKTTADVGAADIVYGVLYIDSTGKVDINNGTGWVTIAEPAETTIPEDESKDAKLATIGAHKAYLNSKLAGMAHDITYDESTMKLTIPMIGTDGVSAADSLVINLPKDNFITGGEYVAEYDDGKGGSRYPAIVLHVGDGTTAKDDIVIPASELVDVYTAENAANSAITVVVSSDNKISASLKVKADTILSITDDGYLTADVSALTTAVNNRLEVSKVISSFTPDNTADDTYVPSAKLVYTTIGHRDVKDEGGSVTSARSGIYADIENLEDRMTWNTL